MGVFAFFGYMDVSVGVNIKARTLCEWVCVRLRTW